MHDGTAPPRRLDHVGIATLDADRSAAWYVDVLGLVVMGDEYVQAADVRLVYLVAPGSPPDVTTVQLVQPFGPGMVRRFVDSNGEGLHHLCFAVDNIEAVLAGGGVDSEHVFLGGRGRRACFLSERASGVVVELTETMPVVAPR